MGFILHLPSCPAGLNDSMSGAMQLLPDPLYSIPTDNTYLLAITSTDVGRIFLAGKDGCLYEIAYQAEAGWFSQRCRKINHSKSSLSFLIPSLLQFSFSEDGRSLIQHTQSAECLLPIKTCCLFQIPLFKLLSIIQGTFYTRVQRRVSCRWVSSCNQAGIVVFVILSDVLMWFRVCQVYDLGADGQGMSRVAAMSQNSIVSAAGNIAR